MKNIKVDSYSDLQYVKGFPDHVLVNVYDKNSDAESIEVSVDIDEFADFIERKDIEEYFRTEDMITIEADLEVFLTRKAA